ncbi:carbon-nitrogen family hydrolase [Paenibacillus sp. Marseille-Q4541]|uniref:carbon-nitrogen family hydrolase n=1 Tax=Paenibacillus sp. Marseille-Q4541 TaxID=2831522 RepID=UPI001BA9100D|nr:carbon-nitrogen family hydrolase [Paenibacillus sp. Marseille-Q4541]
MTELTKDALLQIVLIQSDIQIGNPDANRKHMQLLIKQAMENNPNAEIIVLPEMWNTGYALSEIHELADDQGKIEREWLQKYAAQYKVNIVAGSISEKVDGQIYNSMYIFNKEGKEVARYAKMHLFRLMDEEKYLASGEEPVTFTFDGNWTAGASICYDIRFPELGRTLALNGAKVLFVPAEWPHPRLHHWRTLLMARAIENQMYVVSCNRVGVSKEAHFFGHSMIIDPWGEIVAEGGDQEEILTGTIDPALVDEVRGRIPVFEDRRPNLYFEQK